MDENGMQANEGGVGEGPNPPRSWLTPYLLMLLRTWEGYGYELVRQLALFGFGWVDPGTVYRALRELEREGCVRSRWDTSGGSGPARRLYTITDAGIEALGLWATTLEGYRQILERFFQQYGGTPPPSGAAPGPTRERKSTGRQAGTRAGRGGSDQGGSDGKPGS